MSARKNTVTKPDITASLTVVARSRHEHGRGAVDATVLLDSVTVHGHEVDPAKNFQLCTALSMLVRTLLHLLQCTDGVDAHIEIPHEGSAVITDIKVRSDLHDWFAGVSALFLRGMQDLVEQFPKKLLFEVKRAR